MDNIKLYEINANYVTYLSSYETHLFQNKKAGQKNERKYIGIVLHINGFDYFAPLSSFKDKHRLMKEGIDFIKVKDYAVINLNNMFPVPLSETKYVDIRRERSALPCSSSSGVSLYQINPGKDLEERAECL
ncbi:MAG: type III toxin-antitoxin system ToxN/AbiQ family toxin [Clostridia bacterium]|nr:type III toxin-antitoxin system ToxN/AbiQ family toxin [Clostridia bacterium]